MSNHPQPVPCTLRLKFGGSEREIKLQLPQQPVTRLGLLPVLQDFDNQLVDLAAQESQRQGKMISCCAGCGACCRQLVPISEPEAFHLARVVEQMPEPRQSLVRQRFAEALQVFRQSGLLDRIQRILETAEGSTRAELGLAYFRHAVACPFLEEESCSIYPDRPLGCREFLVSSPAENCLNPSPEGIDRVPLPGELSAAFYRFGPGGETQPPRWLPLILALDFAANLAAENATTEEVKIPGDQLFQKLLGVAAGG